MSKLEEVRKKIYSKEGPGEHKRPALRSQAKRRKESKSQWEGGLSAEELEKIVYEQPTVEAKTAEVRKKSLFWAIFIGAFFVAAALVISLFIYTSFYTTNTVRVDITAKSSVDAADTQNWTVVVRNDGTVPLKNGELTFLYPRDALILSETADKKSSRSKIIVEEVRPGEERKFDFSARLFGNAGDEKTAEALFVYSQENVTSRFSKSVKFITLISRVPLAVFFDWPDRISSGQDMKVIVDVSSSAKAVFKDLYLRVDYPPGFKFLSSDTKPDYANNIWKFGDMGPGENRRLLIGANIEGSPEEVKHINAVVGNYNPDTKQWNVFAEKGAESRIASPFLLVRHEVNGSRDYISHFGDDLRFTVYYKNNFPVSARDVFIRTKLSEKVFDMSSLKVEKGVFDGETREIVWNAATVPSLKEVPAGGTGMVNFFVKIKNRPSIQGPNDKNFVASAETVINTETVPQGYSGLDIKYSNKFEFKIETKLVLNAKAVFFNSPLGPNEGSLPPRLGQNTGYTVIFQIADLSNDVRDVRVKASLPGNVRWLDKTLGDKMDQVIFNPSSGELIWNVGDIPAGTGVNKPQVFLAFNISLSPGEDALKSSALLLGNIRLSGVDNFTGTVLGWSANDLTTELRDDPLTNTNQWRVER